MDYSYLRRNPIISHKMEEPGGWHAKWIKPDTEEQISVYLAYMWNLKKMKLQEQKVKK